MVEAKWPGLFKIVLTASGAVSGQLTVNVTKGSLVANATTKLVWDKKAGDGFPQDNFSVFVARVNAAIA